jgi:hypothetical protein
MKIELPASLIKSLGPEMAMDVHWIDLKLKNGKILKKVVVRGGRFISGRDTGSNQEEAFELKKEDIIGLRRHSLLPVGRFSTVEAEPAGSGQPM